MAIMWILITLIASLLQTLRNSFQRALTQKAGVWAGTWVRFAFGVPITLVALFIIIAFRGHFEFHVSAKYYLMCLLGAVAQVVATAALLGSMERAGFAIGITFNNSSVILTALYGVAFLGDHLQFMAWAGIIVSTLGIIIASLPKGIFAKKAQSELTSAEKSANSLKLHDALIAAALGILSGGLFAISTNSFRVAVNLVENNPNFFSGTITVLVVQTMQTVLLGLVMYLVQRKSLVLAIKDWKSSINAGWAGAGGSILWFVALGMVPAAMVRVVNLLLEMPMSILMGRIKFKEKLPVEKLVAIVFVVAGVIMAIVGH